MKLLVLGGTGMAGHMLKQYFRAGTLYDVWSTARVQTSDPQCLVLDVTDESKLCQVLSQVRPDIVLNAVGILNQFAEQYIAQAIHVNSLLPHQLVKFADRLGFQIVHISTDCVFSGLQGQYTEHSVADGTTVYAKTKSLGEIVNDKHLTIRTSIIGPELKRDGIGLFHWFMQQKGIVPGFQRVLWNGVTTLELAKAMQWSIEKGIHGLVHLTGEQPLTKYALLKHLEQVFRKSDVQIVEDFTVVSDKTLLNTRPDFTWKTPAYVDMLAELKEWMETYGKGVYSYAT